MNKIIFWGATGQAKVLRECLKHTQIQLVALFDNNYEVVSPFPDVPLYYGRDGFANWFKLTSPDEKTGCLVAIGGDKGKDRIEIQEYLESYGIHAIIAQHPTAYVAENVIIGGGSQVLAQAAVCVESMIGRSCIINTAATVDHECRLDDGIHICPGARLAGCVEVGKYATIGTGAVILPRIKIGEGAIVGAGAVVTKDVSPYTVVLGNPARLWRKIKND
ncbi:MAG: acetyltransferase [Oscillatoriaceae cyanobacterium]